MDVTITRKYRAAEYTIGEMAIDGVRFCDTLEDKDRELSADMSLPEIVSRKVRGETAIPVGTYRMDLTHSPKFGRTLPEILNVPGYIGIRVHRGNDHTHTEGCPLVGENKAVGRVINSTQYERALVERMRTALVNGEEITITIR